MFTAKKTLYISAEESKELAEFAAKKSVINYVGFNNTQNPANAYVRELVQSGKLLNRNRFVKMIGNVFKRRTEQFINCNSTFSSTTFKKLTNSSRDLSIKNFSVIATFEH